MADRGRPARGGALSGRAGPVGQLQPRQRRARAPLPAAGHSRIGAPLRARGGGQGRGARRGGAREGRSAPHRQFEGTAGQRIPLCRAGARRHAGLRAAQPAARRAGALAGAGEPVGRADLRPQQHAGEERSVAGARAPRLAVHARAGRHCRPGPHARAGGCRRHRPAGGGAGHRAAVAGVRLHAAGAGPRPGQRQRGPAPQARFAGEPHRGFQGGRPRQPGRQRPAHHARHAAAGAGAGRGQLQRNRFHHSRCARAPAGWRGAPGRRQPVQCRRRARGAAARQRHRHRRRLARHRRLGAAARHRAARQRQRGLPGRDRLSRRPARCAGDQRPARHGRRSARAAGQAGRRRLAAALRKRADQRQRPLALSRRRGRPAGGGV